MCLIYWAKHLLCNLVCPNLKWKSHLRDSGKNQCAFVTKITCDSVCWFYDPKFICVSTSLLRVRLLYNCPLNISVDALRLCKRPPETEPWAGLSPLLLSSPRLRQPPRTSSRSSAFPRPRALLVLSDNCEACVSRGWSFLAASLRLLQVRQQRPKCTLSS